MTDIVLNAINSGYNLSKINDNFQKTEDKINDEILHLTGGNNVLQQDLDINSNRIINLPLPISNTEPVRQKEFQELSTNGIVSNNIGSVKDIVDLSNIDTSILVDDQQFKRLEFWPDSAVGGDELYWKDDEPVANHDGIKTIDPAKISELNTTNKTFGTYFTPDTVSGNTGCFVSSDEFVTVNQAGAVGDGVVDDTTAFQQAIDYLVSGGRIGAERGDYSTVTPASLSVGTKAVALEIDNNVTLPSGLPFAAIQSRDDFTFTGWTGDSPRPQVSYSRMDFGEIDTPENTHVDAAHAVVAKIADNASRQTGTREFAAYAFDIESLNQGTASTARGLRGHVRANGGENTVRAVRIMSEGTSGHTGELTGVLSTVIHTDLNDADPPTYNPVSGTAFQAELGAGSVRGFLATGWPGQSRPSYGFLSGTGSRAILPEISHYMAHGGGNGDMYAAFVDENSAELSYTVDNVGRVAARSFFSGFVTVNDDEVQTIIAPADVGFLEVWTTSAAAQVYGKAFFKVVSGPFATDIYSGTSLTFTTGTLSGTTGVDGEATVSALADGTIKIENRTGIARNFAIHFTCESQPASTFKVLS